MSNAPFSILSFHPPSLHTYKHHTRPSPPFLFLFFSVRRLKPTSPQIHASSFLVNAEHSPLHSNYLPSMKDRRHRRLDKKISKLHSELEAVSARDFSIRQELETATATLTGVEARKKAKLEASIRAQLLEAENEVGRALQNVTKAESALITAETAAKASR